MAELSPRTLLPRFLEQGRAETARLSLLMSDGSSPSVTAATYTLLDADGVAVISAQAATVTGSTITYAIPSTFADSYTLPVEEWRERWTLSGVSGDVAAPVFELTAYLCRRAPALLLTIDDLASMHPQWKRQLQRAHSHGAADSPILLAWGEMIRRLLADGVLPQKVLNPWALTETHRYWAAAIVCRDFMTDVQDASRWERLGAEYWERSQSEYERLAKVKLDMDDDGIVDTGRESVAPSGGSTPRMWRWT